MPHEHRHGAIDAPADEGGGGVEVREFNSHARWFQANVSDIQKKLKLLVYSHAPECRLRIIGANTRAPLTAARPSPLWSHCVQWFYKIDSQLHSFQPGFGSFSAGAHLSASSGCCRCDLCAGPLHMRGQPGRRAREGANGDHVAVSWRRRDAPFITPGSLTAGDGPAEFSRCVSSGRRLYEHA